MSHALLSSSTLDTQPHGHDDAFLSAIEKGDVTAARFWLTKNASIDAKRNGRNALWLAASRRQLEAVKFLVEECGVSVDAGACSCDETARQDCDCQTALVAAVDYNISSIVAYLLGKGAEVNTTYYDFDRMEKKPLSFLSSRNNSTDLVKLLLDYKMDLNFKTNSGWNLLHHSISMNCINVFNFLIEKKADINEKIRGKTAWMAAAAFESDSIMIMLRKKQPSLLAETDKEGYSAFQNYGSEVLSLKFDQEPASIENQRYEIWCAQLLHLFKSNQFSDEAWASVYEGLAFYGNLPSALPAWLITQYNKETLQSTEFSSHLIATARIAKDFFLSQMKIYLSDIFKTQLIPEKLDLFLCLTQRAIQSHFISREVACDLLKDFQQNISQEKNIAVLKMTRNCLKLQDFTNVICEKTWKINNKKYCLDLTMLSEKLRMLLTKCFEEILGQQHIRLDENNILTLEDINEKHLQKLTNEKSKSELRKVIKEKRESSKPQQHELKEKIIELKCVVEKLKQSAERVKNECFPYFNCTALMPDNGDKKNEQKKRKGKTLRALYDKLSVHNFSSLQDQINNLLAETDSPENFETTLQTYQSLFNLYNAIKIQIENISHEEREARKFFTDKELYPNIRPVTLIQPGVPSHLDRIGFENQKKERAMGRDTEKKVVPQTLAPSDKTEKAISPPRQILLPKREKSEATSPSVLLPKEGKEEVDDLQRELPKLTKTKKSNIQALSEYGVSDEPLPRTSNKATHTIAAAPNGILGVAINNYDLLSHDFTQFGNPFLCFYANCFVLMRMFHALGALPRSYGIEKFLSIEDALAIRDTIMHHLMDTEIDEKKIQELQLCITQLKGQNKFSKAMQKLRDGTPLSREDSVDLKKISFLEDLLKTSPPLCSLEKNIQVIKLHLNYLTQYEKNAAKLEEQFHVEGILQAAIKMSITILGQKIKELPPQEKRKFYEVIFQSSLKLWDEKLVMSEFEKLRGQMGHDLEKGAEKSAVTYNYEEVGSFTLLDIVKKARALKYLLDGIRFFEPKSPTATLPDASPALPEKAPLAPSKISQNPTTLFGNSLKAPSESPPTQNMNTPETTTKLGNR